MGNRLSKITTRTGDQGSTGLADGSRLAKSAPRIQAIGDIDELNSVIGVLIANLGNDAHRGLLANIQHRLFDLGGELAVPGRQVIGAAQVRELEDAVETLNKDLAPLKEFILPGGSADAAYCHLARTVCRRAERSWVAMNGLANDAAENAQPSPTRALAYLNRLSDLLFVLARVLNRDAGEGDVLWQPAAKP